MPICSSHREAGVGNVQQGVLLRRIHGHAEFARHGGIDEFDDDVGADAFDIAVAPLLERDRWTFCRRLLPEAAHSCRPRSGFDLVRRPVRDVDAAAIRLPSGDTGSVVLVGVSDAAVVLFLELVLDGIGRGIAAQPELLDELLALFVGLQPLEGLALFIGDDVDDVLVQPLLVRGLRAPCAVWLRAFSFPSRSAAWRPFRVARGSWPPA